MTDTSKFEGHTPGPWKTLANYIYSRDANVCAVGEPRAKTTVGYTDLDVGSPDAAEAYANARLIAAAPDILSTNEKLTAENARLREALTNVRSIIVDGELTGFNCHNGDWAERLFASQADTHAALTQSQE